MGILVKIGLITEITPFWDLKFFPWSFFFKWPSEKKSHGANPEE
jgi:hypothetical protein